MTPAERVILDRYHRKGLAAGGVRPGYVLRRGAILYVADRHPGVDLESGLETLVEKEILKSNEERTFFFLTASGVDKIAELSGD